MYINKVFSCLKSKVSWKIVEWIALLGLLILTGLFAFEVWYEYVSNATSVKTYFEVQENLHLPVIVMCFNPPIKPSIRKKYNTTLGDIFGTVNNPQSNITIYEEGVYTIGRDFNITFLGNGINSHNVEVKALHTFVSGMCYRINANHKISVKEVFSLNMMMRKSLEFKPIVSFYFASEQNSYNVIDNRVMGQVLFIETKSIGYHAVMLQKSRYLKLHEVSNCNQENTIPMECVGQRFSKIVVVCQINLVFILYFYFQIDEISQCN